MKKNVIEFSENGKIFVFKFISGAESAAIESKGEGFEAITKLLIGEKISLEEFKEMGKQIIEAKELPDRIETEEDFLESLIGVMSLMVMKEILHELCPLPTEPVKEAYLHIYEKCKKYGVIYGRDNLRTGPIISKKHAKIYLKKLKKEGEINEAEYTKLKVEIENSPLKEKEE